MITQKEVRRLFSYNKKTGVLRWKISRQRIQKGDIAGSRNKKGYIVVSVNGKDYKAHKLIWLGMTGSFPKGQIDHKDRIKWNNMWDNLEEVTQIKNMQNIGNFKSNTSGVKGVSFDKNRNKWIAYIKMDKKKYHLGSFKDFDEAVCHRLAAEQCLNWNGILNSPAYKYVLNM